MNRIATTLAVGALLGSSAASANHIDFLDGGAFTLTDSGGGSASTETVTGIDPAATLGGQRTLTLSVDGPETNTATASLTAPFDALTYTTSAAGTFELANSNDLGADFLNIPDSEADWDGVRINFGPGSAIADLVTVWLMSETGELLTSSQSFAGGDTNLDFLFTDFGEAATTDFLENIDAAVFEINAPGAGTYFIESFTRERLVAQAVPEPGTLGLMLLGLGLFGAAALRRRA